MLLSVIVPAKSNDDPMLKNFLRSLIFQDLAKDQYEVLVETRGNSEQAKAYAIQRAKGDVLGFFCSDNFLRESDFLFSMAHLALMPHATGSYTARYDYVRTDKALSRYCTLMGSNDPLCWWMEKSDRCSYFTDAEIGFVSFPLFIPSLGDNGFFVKRSAIAKIQIDPDTHFPMDMCEDLRKAGEFTYYRSIHRIWHKTGESFFDYFRRRYVYTRDLYFGQKDKRRWHMVGQKDWTRVGAFCACSLLVVPHLWTSWRGFRKVHDWAWFLHPMVCFILTFLYGICYLQWRMKRLSSFLRLTGRRVLIGVLNLFGNRPSQTLKLS